MFQLRKPNVCDCHKYEHLNSKFELFKCNVAVQQTTNNSYNKLYSSIIIRAFALGATDSMNWSAHI